MKIRFLQDYQVKAENGPFYKAGEVHDLPDLSAKHFLRKGRAEVVNPDSIDEPEVKPKSEAKSKMLGERGGDPVTRGKKAQQAYREKVLKGEK